MSLYDRRFILRWHFLFAGKQLGWISILPRSLDVRNLSFIPEKGMCTSSTKATVILLVGSCT